jgi:outer membrane receptor protein involved in Fe transport
VGVDQETAYLQGRYAGEGRLNANLGLRMVKTKLDVTQNNVGAPQPYGAANIDAGDTVTRREFTDYLPSLNVSYDFTDTLKLRGSFAKTMVLLDLEQWGGALSPSYAISNAEGGRFIVIGANSNGNPELDPWRSKNYDLSLEWYAGDQTLVSAALFYVRSEIQSVASSRMAARSGWRRAAHRNAGTRDQARAVTEGRGAGQASRSRPPVDGCTTSASMRTPTPRQVRRGGLRAKSKAVPGQLRISPTLGSG